MISSQVRRYGRTAIGSLLAKRTTSSAATAKPIVELREYELHPSQAALYAEHTTEGSDLRKSLTPLRIFSMPETGGRLNVATHLYYFWGGFEERNERRAEMAKSDDWNSYLGKVRPCMINQKSTIFVEAPLVREMENEVCGLAPGMAEGMLNMYEDGEGAADNEGMQADPGCIIEYRRYQLKLGYETVPRFLELYGKGLPSKLNAPGTDPSTSLVTLLYSEVGQLNEVIELWRHGSTGAMEISRVASRSSTEWRNSIAEIATLTNVFTNTIHKPLSFSPIR